MKPGHATGATYPPWPRWWRMVLIALCTLILCSCQAARQNVPTSSSAVPPPALPQQAFTGAPQGYPGVFVDPMTGAAGPTPAPGVAADGMTAAPLPASPVGPWAPPGLRRDPWPQDEYLSDGGDAVPHASVGQEWEINGLNVEDTVAHFDTVDGRRIVTPSNRLCIYSPRFRSVRQVVGLRQNEQRDPWAGVHQPLKLVRHEDVTIAATSKQQVQLEAEIGRDLPGMYRSKQGDGAMSTVNGPVAFQDRLLPFEAPLAIGQGVVQESEMAWLTHGTTAAIAWSGAQPVQVFIDRTRAAAEVGDRRLDVVYTIKERKASPKLRVIKLASTQFAAPGETIDFTLRFDNVGDEVIGNVTVVDNLTTRLEYVPQSAQCSVPAQFSTEPNEADSLALRWEIADSLPAGQGGIIRFRCRVR
ncbi:MAG TPA: hypothetical protein VMY37_27390 [Thermoguttaceae bacterium]|nr:hypothetical protein [Thermoguttaceae bacterium]